MAINFLGDEYPVMPRIQTGFWSLDRSLSSDKTHREIGWPLRTMSEIFGPPGLGKTTFCLSIGGIIASKLGGNIAVCPIDNLDRDIANTILSHVGFAGDMHFSFKDTDEKSVEGLLDLHWEEKENNIAFALLDSLASISPISEREGDVGDANMGRRAKIAATMSRKVNHNLKMRTTPSVFFFTNHVHQNIGFVGSTTAGGVTAKYMSQIRIKLKSVDDFDEGTVLEGKVEKFNFGPDKRSFHVLMIGGEGLHLGLSAMFDCIYTKRATAEKVVKMDGKSYGRVNKIIEERNDEDLFKPFVQMLNSDPKIDTNNMTPDELLEA